jgi:hypothetical protein
MEANYFFFLEETTLATARRVAARPAVPALGAAFTFLLDVVWPSTLAAADFVTLGALGSRSAFPAWGAEAIVGAFFADMSDSLNLR